MSVLSDLFTDIAGAIRGKTGEEGTMKPIDFPSKIESISVGGGGTVDGGGSTGVWHCKSDEFIATSEIQEIYHGCKVVPDIVLIDARFAVADGNYLTGTGGYSQRFMDALNSTDKYIGIPTICMTNNGAYAVSALVEEGIDTESSTANLYGSVRNCTSEKFTVGGEYYPLVVGKFYNCCYMWYTGTFNGSSSGDLGDSSETDDTPRIEYTYDESGNIVTASFVNMTKVPDHVCRGNKTLVSVDFSGSPKLSEIGEYAFYDCSALTSITLPDGLKKSCTNAFNGCLNLKSVYFEGTLEQWLAIEIIGIITIASGCKLYIQGEEIRGTLEIPEGITSIGDYCFYKVSALTNIVVPASAQYIGRFAFYYSGITSATFSDTEGWYITTTKGATSGTTLSVTDTTTNATWLKDTYRNYYWYNT